MKPINIFIVGNCILLSGCVSLSYHERKIHEARTWGLSRCEDYTQEKISRKDLTIMIQRENKMSQLDQ